MTGATGAAVSTVTVKTAEVELTLPAASVEVTVKLCTPSGIGPVVNAQACVLLGVAAFASDWPSALTVPVVTSVEIAAKSTGGLAANSQLPSDGESIIPTTMPFARSEIETVLSGSTVPLKASGKPCPALPKTPSSVAGWAGA